MTTVEAHIAADVHVDVAHPPLEPLAMTLTEVATTRSTMTNNMTMSTPVMNPRTFAIDSCVMTTPNVDVVEKDHVHSVADL